MNLRPRPSEAVFEIIRRACRQYPFVTAMEVFNVVKSRCSRQGLEVPTRRQFLTAWDDLHPVDKRL